MECLVDESFLLELRELQRRSIYGTYISTLFVLKAKGGGEEEQTHTGEKG